jgi:poly(3-hydroxybutyrate) depolymerase
MPSLPSLLAAIIALVTTASPCLAGALIEIRGANDEQRPLPVYLARPTGAGSFPAVVVLHGCGGFNNVAVTWADRLARWGYVTVAVDSLTSRGRRTGCSGGVEKLFARKFRASVAFNPHCTGGRASCGSDARSGRRTG